MTRIFVLPYGVPGTCVGSNISSAFFLRLCKAVVWKLLNRTRHARDSGTELNRTKDAVFTAKARTCFSWHSSLEISYHTNTGLGENAKLEVR